jgi:hypothetical protein
LEKIKRCTESEKIKNVGRQVRHTESNVMNIESENMKKDKEKKSDMDSDRSIYKTKYRQPADTDEQKW